MLAEHELVCPSCGNLRSVCSDESRAWTPFRVFCGPSAAIAVSQRRLQKKYSKEPGTEMHPLDGVSVGAALDDFDPEGTFFD